LKFFGVSSKSLQDYVTTDKDLIRNFNRVPEDYFLLDQDASNKAIKSENAVLDDLADEVDDFFDFVLIDAKDI
jgi:hypothetical protein